MASTVRVKTIRSVCQLARPWRGMQMLVTANMLCFIFHGAMTCQIKKNIFKVCSTMNMASARIWRSNYLGLVLENFLLIRKSSRRPLSLAARNYGRLIWGNFESDTAILQYCHQRAHKRNDFTYLFTALQ